MGKMNTMDVFNSAFNSVCNAISLYTQQIIWMSAVCLQFSIKDKYTKWAFSSTLCDLGAKLK